MSIQEHMEKFKLLLENRSLDTLFSGILSADKIQKAISILNNIDIEKLKDIPNFMTPINGLSIDECKKKTLELCNSEEFKETMKLFYDIDDESIPEKIMDSINFESLTSLVNESDDSPEDLETVVIPNSTVYPIFETKSDATHSE